MEQDREDYADPGARRTPSLGALAVVAMFATLAGIAVAVLGVVAFLIWWVQSFIGFN
jgi:hypothetical protein